MTIPDSIPITDILVEDRLRIDHSNTDGLKESLQQFGTIQPIVLTLNPDGRFRLLAGGRRLSFITALGHTALYHNSINRPDRPGFVLGQELPKDTLHELELEENIRRKAMTWQERCISVAELHRLKVVRFGNEGQSWGYKETGELFGIALGRIDYSIALSRLLKSDPKHPLWSIDNINDALRWMTEQKEREAQKEQARRLAELSKQNLQALPKGTDYEVDPDSYLIQVDGLEVISRERIDEKEAARIQYLSNPLNPPDQFEEYYTQKQSLNVERSRIVITPRLYHGSCLDFMAANPGRFDHIITDPPYAIDMDNLAQTNLGMSNIDTVRDTHDVDQNYDLLGEFIPLAYSTMKDSGFLILWADYSTWDFITTTADRVGFKVQRWPVVWVKQHRCMNSAAQYNFTKTTEIAIVCRKGNTTLPVSGPSGHILAAHDDYKGQMDHPFVKPFACWEHLIESCTLKGQTILEPFAGEGSGVLSMIRTERNFFACEKSEVHYNKLIQHVRDEYLRMNPNATFV